MWRPEGWETLKHSPFCGDPGVPCRACGYEAGADAMLGDLRKSGIHSHTFAGQGSTLLNKLIDIYKIPAGRWVFIPDEEA